MRRQALFAGVIWAVAAAFAADPSFTGLLSAAGKSAEAAKWEGRLKT